MFRIGTIRALRAASVPRIIRQAKYARPQASNTFLRPSQAAPSLAVSSIRAYSAPAGLSKEEVQGRIMDLLKNFDKVRHDRRGFTFASHTDIYEDNRCIKGSALTDRLAAHVAC